MKREEIIRMAQSARLGAHHLDDGSTLDALEAFAALVAAHEREQCAAECERMMMYPGCIQESFAHNGVHAAAHAIRARGAK